MTDLYTERLLDHVRHPRRQGRLEAPDLAAEEHNPLCGDRVRVELCVEGGRVAEARFTGRGCALCLGAASILAEAVEGQSLEALRRWDEGAFLSVLGVPVRPARRRCALLPWVALMRALGQDVAGLPDL